MYLTTWSTSRPIRLRRLEQRWPVCSDKGPRFKRTACGAEAVTRRRQHHVQVGLKLDRAVTTPNGDLGPSLAQGAAHRATHAVITAPDVTRHRQHLREPIATGARYQPVQIGDSDTEDP
jgi:hypothetical protein